MGVWLDDFFRPFFTILLQVLFIYQREHQQNIFLNQDIKCIHKISCLITGKLWLFKYLKMEKKIQNDGITNTEK